MKWHLGTMGFSYPQWAYPSFYPPGTRPGEYLSYYARCYDTVELDTTFYAAPDTGRVVRWASQVPEHFRFSLKTPRDITHADDVGAMSGAFLRFLEPLSHFGAKLGVVLLQFPPTFIASRWRELERLARTIPPEVPVAAEFRHPSWYTSANTTSFLSDYHITFASSDYSNSTGELIVPRRLNRSTDTLYLRLIGFHDHYPNLNREERDPTEDLRYWLGAIDEMKGSASTCWVLVNNDYAGHSPATVDRIARMIGRDPQRPLAVETTLFG